jgi:hypothetical protein
MVEESSGMGWIGVVSEMEEGGLASLALVDFVRAVVAQMAPVVGLGCDF